MTIRLIRGSTYTRVYTVFAKPFDELGKSGESQRKMKEWVFGKCEYSKKLEKSFEYFHSLNLHASDHLLVLP